jgi:hypothetical protein
MLREDKSKNQTAGDGTEPECDQRGKGPPILYFDEDAQNVEEHALNSSSFYPASLLQPYLFQGG